MPAKCVKPLHKVPFGDEFQVIREDGSVIPTVYKHDRGDGLYSRVSFQNGTNRKQGSMYIGTPVLH